MSLGGFLALLHEDKGDERASMYKSNGVESSHFIRFEYPHHLPRIFWGKKQPQGGFLRTTNKLQIVIS